LLRSVDFAAREKAVVQYVVNMEVRVNHHANVAGPETPFLQFFQQPMGLMGHAGVNNDVMVAAGEERASGPAPTAGKQYFSFP
jgi:hypothetical protein